MIVYISPAKGFNEVEMESRTLPIFLNESEFLIENLKKYSIEDLEKLMKINSKLAKLNYDRFQNFEFSKDLTPAIYGYDGIQYKTIDIESLDWEDIEYLDEHLRIISGLYGVLKPLDGIYPYRLEMGTKLILDKNKNLYDFWGDKIYKNLAEESDGVIVNLASLEYSKGISKYVENELYIECIFKEKRGDELKIMSVSSKKARGLMVRFIAKNRIEDYRELKKFNLGGYIYREDLSIEVGKKVIYIFAKN